MLTHSNTAPNWAAGCRFAKQVLETGGNAAATLESADTVYVYDYCYIMKQAADSSSQRHWLLKDIYNGDAWAGRCAAEAVQVGLLYHPIGCTKQCKNVTI